MSRPARLARHLPALLAWTLVTGVATLLVLMVLLPRVTGWVPLTVLSGSMEPTIATGSLVVVEPIDGEADLAGIDVGDVITFLPNPDDPTLVTHRVVSEGGRADGTTVFTTRGDANDVDDSEPVGATQIRGLMRYHLPYAGSLSTLLNIAQKQVGVVIVAVGLFLYAAFQLLQTVHGRRHPDDDPAASPTPADRTGTEVTQVTPDQCQTQPGAALDLVLVHEPTGVRTSSPVSPTLIRETDSTPMTSMFGAIAGTSPSFCPRCGTRVDITSQGTITPHNSRVAGPTCDGAGLPAAAVPPWPGTIKPAISHKRFRVQRLGRPARRQGRHSAAQ